MAFDKKLLEIIACPVCKGKLLLTTLPVTKDNESAVQELVCRFDRLAYPIKDNIPVLLENEARLLSLDELEKVKA